MTPAANMKLRLYKALEILPYLRNWLDIRMQASIPVQPAARKPHG